MGVKRVYKGRLVTVLGLLGFRVYGCLGILGNKSSKGGVF